MASDLTLKVACILLAVLGSVRSQVCIVPDAQGKVYIHDRVSAECPIGWHRWRDACVYLSHTTDNGNNANKSCQEMDSHLAVIEYEAENKFLVDLLNHVHPNYDAWIGLWKSEEEDKSCDIADCVLDGWTWFGGFSINSFEFWPNWRPGEPSGHDGEYCARMDKDGFWRDTKCTLEYYYICEKQLLDPYIGSTTGEKYTSMAPEGECPDNLPIVIGAAVGGVLLGVLITCIVFIVLYRRMKHNHQIKRSEPTKHRSGLSAQDNRVVSEYDSNATYVNEIPCVALATAEQPDKASDVNGFDENTLTNKYEHLKEKKKTANQNASTSDDDGAYTTLNVIETSFPEVIP
ncbi:hypothetical protein CAPTEDRAFT_206300 [Capitella teleta]|uniref:C-type lectin domain-containing protein n=1 Tax=Capitella teleta TaxID=283909 RepID=R7TU66_CAPTE|nr:hypothetical protein CAPTEDRAFT_206300 [Capitella teleta]|eukprot:ELT94565.1 hypothetical protein CAPTEDRAFT_206300 [Capitella teleta]